MKVSLIFAAIIVLLTGTMVWSQENNISEHSATIKKSLSDSDIRAMVCAEVDRDLQALKDGVKDACDEAVKTSKLVSYESMVKIKQAIDKFEDKKQLHDEALKKKYSKQSDVHLTSDMLNLKNYFKHPIRLRDADGTVALSITAITGVGVDFIEENMDIWSSSGLVLTVVLLWGMSFLWWGFFDMKKDGVFIICFGLAIILYVVIVACFA